MSNSPAETEPTPVNTAKVTGRRELHFRKLSDILVEAQRTAAAKQCQRLGNWSLGQCLGHLAHSMHMSIDGPKLLAPWHVRLFATFIKKKVLHRMSPGVMLPADAEKDLVPPASTSAIDGLHSLQQAIARLNSTDERRPSPMFGRLTRDEWDRFHLRHAEMHLSFFVPR